VSEASPEHKQISESISALADLTFKMSVDKMEATLDAKRKEYEERLSNFEKRFIDAWSNKPTLSITFDENKSTKQLTNRVNLALPRLIANAKLGLNTMLVGPAGCGKTTVAHQVSESLGLQFGSVCLTAGASETWLFGRQTASGFIEGVFAKLYKEGGVFLADEMDAADANLLLSINTALSHNAIINPMNGECLTKHKDFIFIGAANTNGKGASHIYTGRSRLDAATLDRMVIIKVDYDGELERQLCPIPEVFAFLMETRTELRKSEHDEFVSTRAFSNFFSQYDAGVKPVEIFESLIANWGDGAKDIARRVYAKHMNKSKQKHPSDKKTFYQYIETHIGDAKMLQAEQWSN
jgi:hypothetical protein